MRARGVGPRPHLRINVPEGPSCDGFVAAPTPRFSNKAKMGLGRYTIKREGSYKLFSRFTTGT